MRKNALLVVVALVVALTAVVGPVSAVGAAGRPSGAAAITDVIYYGGSTSPCGLFESCNRIYISWEWSNLRWADGYTWELYNTTGGDGAWWPVADGGFDSFLDAQSTLTYSTDVYDLDGVNGDSYVLIVKVYPPHAPRPIVIITDTWQ